MRILKGYGCVTIEARCADVPATRVKSPMASSSVSNVLRAVNWARALHASFLLHSSWYRAGFHEG